MEALKASLASEGRRPEEAKPKPKQQGVVKLLAGTSGFAFKEWKGTFYPEDMKDDGMLGFYASEVSDGRDQQHVLSAAEGARAARVGVAGAGAVHVRDQGEPAHHALRAAQARIGERASSFC